MPTPNLRCDLLAQRSMAGVAAGGIGVARPTQTPVVEEKRRDDRVVAHQAAPPASVGGAEEPRSPGESSAAAPRMRVQTAWSEERGAGGSGVGSIDDSDLSGSTRCVLLARTAVHKARRTCMLCKHAPVV